ncbi:hypothetical protein BGW41_002108 [Actinomortierella wolfii]|nr:hypothetical protein BGW41_002108 [Actinomortierella wolfii]
MQDSSTTLTIKEEVVSQDKPKRLLLETVELPARSYHHHQQSPQPLKSEPKSHVITIGDGHMSPSPLPSPSISPRRLTPDITQTVAVVPESSQIDAQTSGADTDEEDEDYEEEEDEEEVTLGSLYPTEHDEPLLTHNVNQRPNSRASEGQKNRTKYSDEDLRILNEVFASVPNPDQLMRQRLADRLGKKEEQIKTWFARRRIAANQHHKAMEARAERRSSSSPNMTAGNTAIGGSPSSPRQLQGRSGTSIGKPPSRETSPSTTPSKMSASEITKNLIPILRGGSIAREDDVPQVVGLMRAADDEEGRRFLLNALKLNRNPHVARRLIQANVMDVFKNMLMESRKAQNGANETSSSSSLVISPSLLLLILEVLDSLPLESKHVDETSLSREVTHLAKHKNPDVSIKAKALSEAWEKKVRGRSSASSSDDSSGKHNKKQRTTSRDDDRLFEQMSVQLPSFSKKKPVPSDTTPKSKATVNANFFKELMTPAAPKPSKSSGTSASAAGQSNARPPANSSGTKLSLSSPGKSKSSENTSSESELSSSTGSNHARTKRKDSPNLHIDSQAPKRKVSIPSNASTPSTPSPSSSPTSARAMHVDFDPSLPSQPVGTMEEAQAVIQQRRLQRAQRAEELAAASPPSSTPEPSGIVKFEVDMNNLLSTPLTDSPSSSVTATATSATTTTASTPSIPGSILRKTPAAGGQANKKVVRFEFGEAFLKVREFDKDLPVTFQDGDELPGYDDEDDDGDEDDDEEDEEEDGGEGYDANYHFQDHPQYYHDNGECHWMADGSSGGVGHYHQQRQMHGDVMETDHGARKGMSESSDKFYFSNDAMQIMLRGDLWYPPAPIGGLENIAEYPYRGLESQEKHVQEAREALTLSASDFDLEHMPDSPAEPDPEPVDPNAVVRPIPLYVNDNENPDNSTAVLSQLLAQLVSQNQQQQQQVLQQQMQLTALYGGLQQQQQQAFGASGVLGAFGQWAGAGASYGSQPPQQALAASQPQHNLLQAPQHSLQDADQRITALLGLLPNLQSTQANPSFYHQ